MGTEPTDVLRRSIGVAFSDGGLLAVSARRPEGGEGHGGEVTAAVLCGPDGAPVEVGETLLSTEYGPDGVQRRATLEKTYAALEVALGKLQSQSSWLAGQLASLPQMSSGS